MKMWFYLVPLILMVLVCLFYYLVYRKIKDEKRQLFELNLALFVFILGVLSAALGGWYVHELTDVSNPNLQIFYSDLDENKIVLSITNYNDYPTGNIYLNYTIREFGISKRILIDPMFKGSEKREINISDINKSIYENIQKYLKNFVVPNSSTIYIEFGPSGTIVANGSLLSGTTIRGYTSSLSYRANIFVECDTCKKGDIKNPSITKVYKYDIICNSNRIVNCNLTRSMG